LRRNGDSGHKKPPALLKTEDVLKPLIRPGDGLGEGGIEGKIL